VKQMRIPPAFVRSTLLDFFPHTYILARLQLLTCGKHFPIGRTIPPVHAVSAPCRSNSNRSITRRQGALTLAR
jgi:hypothetical protein